MLEIKKISKKYHLSKKNDQIILDNANLTMEYGDFVAIYGPSGSGKSTLLNIIASLDQPDEGVVILDGELLNYSKRQNEDKLAELRRKNVGFIFQNYHLINHMTAIENIALPLILDGVKEDVAYARAKELLVMLGLSEYEDYYPNNMSGGQQQRIAICRALVHDPNLIVADEPTGSLDYENSETILKILSEIAKSGKIVIVVTHDDQVLKYANKKVNLFDGKTEEQIKKRQRLTFDHQKFYSSIKQGAKIGYRNILQRKKRFLLTALAASIAVISSLLGLSVINGMENYIHESTSKYANPRVSYVKNIVDIGELMFVLEVPLTERDLRLVAKKDDRIINATPRLVYRMNYLLEDQPSQLKLYSIFETVDGVHDINPNEILFGRVPTPEEHELIITHSFASMLVSLDDETSNLETIIGQNLTFYIEETNRGIKSYTEYPFEIVGVFHEDAFLRNDGYDINQHAFTSYLTMKDLSSEHYSLRSEDAVGILIAESSEANDELIKLYKDGFYNLASLRYYNPNRLGDLIHFINSLNVIYLILVATSIIAGALLIGIMINLSVLERSHEIGVLRSIGARKKDIRNIFTFESLYLGAAVGVIGLLIYYLIQILSNLVIRHYVTGAYYFQFALPMKWMIPTLLISMVLSLFSSVYAIVFTSNMNPIQALKK